jgi:hypothetical protein
LIIDILLQIDQFGGSRGYFMWCSNESVHSLSPFQKYLLLACGRFLDTNNGAAMIMHAISQGMVHRTMYQTKREL